MHILFTILIAFSCAQPLLAQSSSRGIADMEKALEQNNVDHAQRILQQLTDEYYRQQKPDSLVKYIFYTGKIAQKKKDPEYAVKQVEALLQKIKTLSPPLSTLRQAYIDAGEYYGSVGKNKLAYDANMKAYQYTMQMPERRPNNLGQVENNLSTYAQRLSNVSLLQYHGRRALQQFLQDKQPNYEGLYIAYNGMGSSMYFSSKLDSAAYYWEHALKALAKTERTPINQFYRPAIILNNLSGMYGIQGRTTDAIEALKQTISNIRQFIATKEPHPKKVSAVNFHYEAVDNLAGIYKEMGDLKQARELLEYSYKQKQQNLQPNDPAIFISQILLGQLYYATHDFDKSKQYLQTGFTRIGEADGDYLFWQADACNTLALLHDKLKDFDKAAYYYNKADSLYEASLQGEYDNIYLEFLRNAALFHAENGDAKTGIAKAGKSYAYVLKAQGANTLTAFYQLLNLAEIHLLAKNYKQAADYSNKSLAVVNALIKNSGSMLDSIKTELKKPKAILLKNKAHYHLLAKKDAAHLSAILQELNDALAMVERRKAVLSDASDISLLMADNNELVEFKKAITLELYKLSNSTQHMDALLSLHESALYNRIRSRLDKKDAAQFAHIPVAIIAKEKALKAAITSALTGTGSHDAKMVRYFAAVDNWNNFQAQLQQAHPRYYRLRYQSIFRTANDIRQSVPANASLVRFLFIDKNLYAIVADNKQKQLFALNAAGIDKHIATLSNAKRNIQQTSKAMAELYQQLWAPLASHIHHKQVIIIPDGVLYTLNFDLLTSKQVSNYKELATQSLLAKHAISYRYSSFLLHDDDVQDQKLSNNFVAFAPGFTDNDKQRYRSAVKDSSKMDAAYLSLLPQPFMLSLVNKVKQVLGGKVYANDRSTEKSFKANAGNHKIIHIGTHAEANHNYPEFSRLIFARDTAEAEDNSLYLDEIYNCNLLSDLTVLTACESGKPGYEDGEGMISLAHAFNYAGSESILTGLWKIDEQASAVLVEHFYNNLLQGMTKDEALRQAKLTYLQTAEGRTLSPHYWAGLVVMGDTSPIELKQESRSSMLLLMACASVLVAVFVFINRRYKLIKASR